MIEESGTVRTENGPAERKIDPEDKVMVGKNGVVGSLEKFDI